MNLLVKSFVPASVRSLFHSYGESRRLQVQSRYLQRWRQEQRERNNDIHASLEVTGISLWARNLEVGRFSTLEKDVSLWFSGDEGADARLKVGNHSFVGRNTYVGVFQPVTVGDYVLIGAYSYLISANHSYSQRNVPIRQQGFTGAPIVIEDDVWIGTHVVVLPGVTIGCGAIVAAGSLVNKDVPPFQVWGGVPAKFIKNRP